MHGLPIENASSEQSVQGESAGIADDFEPSSLDLHTKYMQRKLKVGLKMKYPCSLSNDYDDSKDSTFSAWAHSNNHNSLNASTVLPWLALITSAALHLSLSASPRCTTTC